VLCCWIGRVPAGRSNLHGMLPRSPVPEGLRRKAGWGPAAASRCWTGRLDGCLGPGYLHNADLRLEGGPAAMVAVWGGGGGSGAHSELSRRRTTSLKMAKRAGRRRERWGRQKRPQVPQRRLDGRCEAGQTAGERNG
jgi:hypothetical protein